MKRVLHCLNSGQSDWHCVEGRDFVVSLGSVITKLNDVFEYHSVVTFINECAARRCASQEF